MVERQSMAICEHIDNSDADFAAARHKYPLRFRVRVFTAAQARCLGQRQAATDARWKRSRRSKEDREAFEEEFPDGDRMTDLRPSYQRRRLWSVSLSAQRLSPG